MNVPHAIRDSAAWLILTRTALARRANNDHALANRRCARRDGLKQAEDYGIGPDSQTGRKNSGYGFSAKAMPYARANPSNPARR